MYLYELRNLWQLFFHVTVGAFSTLQIRLRQPQGKSPDYNVWQSWNTETKSCSTSYSQECKAVLQKKKLSEWGFYFFFFNKSM